jgi:hypothetical protein
MADMLTPKRAAKPGDSKGFRRMFAPDRLTLGVFFPIEAFSGDQPTMAGQERLAGRAEELDTPHCGAATCRCPTRTSAMWAGVRSVGLSRVDRGAH